MKNAIFLFLITIYSFQAIGQWEHQEPLHGKIVRNELSSINGQFQLQAYWVFTDSMQVVSDSLLVNLPPGWQVTTHTLAGISSWYEKGDSITFTLNVSYPIANLPYYPKALEISQELRSVDGDVFEATLFGRAFFTPWNTLELFDDYDFYRSGRVWKTEQPNVSEPARVFIPKSSIPVCDIVATDTVQYAWQEDYQLADYPGLPFYVKQQPIHPDTLADWETYRVDSTNNDTTSTSNSIALNLGPRYHGNVSGRLLIRQLNDRGEMVDIPLSGIIVELRERDFIDGLSYTTKWDDTYTDNDGFFKLDFDKHQMGEGAGLEFEIKVKAKNDYHRFIVARHTLDNLDINLISQAVFSNHVVGTINTNGGSQNVINMGDIFETDHGFDVASKLENAYRFAEQNGARANTPFQENRLKAFIDAGASGNRTNIVFPNPPRITFSVTGGRRERTIYHEWGHYYMWSLHGTLYPRLLDDNACGLNIGNHGDDEEVHMSLAWIEGFADGIRNILDAAYLADDLEYGLISPNNPDQKRNGYEIRRVPLDQNFNPTLNNGLRSEYNIGLALYDMWDGSNTIPLTIPDPADPENLTINTATLTGGVLFGVPRNTDHPFNDLNNNNLPVTPGTWIGGDNVQISFKDMMKPMSAINSSDVVANVFEYADKLMNDVLKDDCEGKQGVADCFRENRVMLDINGYENNMGNSLDFNTSISGDDIFEEVSFGDFGTNFACIGFTDFIDYKRNPIETAAGHTVSFPNSSFSGGDISEDITDDLRLGFNFPNTQSTFNINSGTKTKSSGVVMHTCGDVVWEFGNTRINIGSDNSPTAEIHFNTGSQFHTGIGTTINIENNSSLIIEPGATLRIGPGTQIILDGPNAILEIRGNLVLEPGAIFAPVGGASGQGFVRFNTSGVWNGATAIAKVDVGVNSSMTFEAANGTTKVLEIAGESLWIDDKNSTNFVFTLKNATAEISHNGMLNLGCRAVFDGATVQKMGSAGHYKGVYLWAKPNNVVKNSTFQHASSGLQFSSTKWGIRLNVENSNFVNNYNGLTVLGGGLTIENSNASDNNGYGILAKGLKLPGFIDYSNMNNNQLRGLRYESNSGAPLTMVKNILQNNPNAMKFISTGDLGMKCNQFIGLGNFGSQTGIEFMSDSLLMTSSRGGLNPFGFNNFKDNEKSIWFKSDWNQYAKIELNEGMNALSNKVNTSDPSTALFGLIDSRNQSNLTANFNKWDNRTSATSCTPSSRGCPESNFGGSPNFENELHKAFSNHKVNMLNYRKEFFNVTIDEIEQKVKETGLDAEIIKLPEAMEYRETIAILEKLKNQGEQKTIDDLIAEEFPTALVN